METRQIFLQKLAKSLNQILKLSPFQVLARGIYYEKTQNPDYPFRLGYRPTKRCPANAIRKRTTREELGKFESMLTGDALEIIYTFLELLEIIKPLNWERMPAFFKTRLCVHLLNFISRNHLKDTLAKQLSREYREIPRR